MYVWLTYMSFCDMCKFQNLRRKKKKNFFFQLLFEVSVQSNYEPLNRNNDCIGQWSWYYRGCWHQTCPPLEIQILDATEVTPKVLSCLDSPHSNWAHKAHATANSEEGNATCLSFRYSTVTACHCLSENILRVCFQAETRNRQNTTGLKTNSNKRQVNKEKKCVFA